MRSCAPSRTPDFAGTLLMNSCRRGILWFRYAKLPTCATSREQAPNRLRHSGTMLSRPQSFVVNLEVRCQ